MPCEYYACNWLMDFDKVNLNDLLDYVDQYALELKCSLIGNKCLRFKFAVNNERQIQELMGEIGLKFTLTDYEPISQEEFESITLIEHSPTDRSKTLKALGIIHQYTQSISAFYRQAHSSKFNEIHFARWAVNKRGLDERIIESAFDIVEQSETVQMATYEDGDAIEFYIVAPINYQVDEITSVFPAQLRNLDWRPVEHNDLPDKLGSNPNNLEPNIYSIWREGLYSKIRK